MPLSSSLYPFPRHVPVSSSPDLHACPLLPPYVVTSNRTPATLAQVGPETYTQKVGGFYGGYHGAAGYGPAALGAPGED